LSIRNFIAGLAVEEEKIVVFDEKLVSPQHSKEEKVAPQRTQVA
jgi:hypothetical protein